MQDKEKHLSHCTEWKKGLVYSGWKEQACLRTQCSLSVPKWTRTPITQDALQTRNKIMAPDPKTSHGNCRTRDCKWICQTNGSAQSMGRQANPSCYGILWVILQHKCANRLFTCNTCWEDKSQQPPAAPDRRMPHVCRAPAGHHPAWNRDGGAQKSAPGRLAPVKCYKNRGQWIQMHFSLPVHPICGWITHWGALPLVVCDISHLDPASSFFPQLPHLFSSKILSSPGNKQRKHWSFIQRNIQPREQISSSHRPIEDQDCLLLKSQQVCFPEKQLFSSQFWVPTLWLLGCLCHIFPQEVAMFLIPVVWHIHVPTQWHTLIQMSLHCI